MGKRRYLLAGIAMSLIFSMTGCQALMEQKKVDPTKTAGVSTYTGFNHIDEEGSDNQILDEGGIICNMAKVTKGQGNFTTFMNKVNDGEPCFIRIKQKAGDAGTYYRDLYFDGSKYRLIISIDPEKYDYTYDYLFDVAGRKNKNCRKSRIVFLSNKKNADYEDISGSIGVNEENQKINYQLVFRNQ